VIEPRLRLDAGFTLAGGLDTAYENDIINFYWSFWQYNDPTSAGFGCSIFPSGTISDAELAAWAGVLVGSTDDALTPLLAYYYQAATQLGDSVSFDTHLTAVLQHRGTNTARHVLPAGITVPAFDPTAMRDIQSWLSSEGRGVVFVYGELDPWSATQFELGQSIDTFKAIALGNNHLSELNDLKATDQQTAMSMVERWLGARRTRARTREAHVPALSLRQVGPPRP
jgi:hypothetical protein